MTQQRLKKPGEAERWLALAVGQIERDAQILGAADGPTPPSWEEKARRQALRREAEKDLKNNPHE